MRNNIRQFKMKLKQLTSMIGGLDSSNQQVQQLKKSLFVLNKILEDERNVVSPYGPRTPMVRYSLN